jgi:VanZ family protein
MDVRRHTWEVDVLRLHRMRFVLFFVLSLLWMAVIYWKSSEPYQVQDVKPLLHTAISESRLLSLLPHIEFTYDGDFVTYHNPYAMFEFFIRKCGHVTEYLILTLFVRQTVASTTWSNGVSWLLSVLIPVLYACTDEYHQTFVVGRTGHLIDVGVDTIGIVIALVLTWLVGAMIKRRRTKHRSSNLRTN